MKRAYKSNHVLTAILVLVLSLCTLTVQAQRHQSGDSHGRYIHEIRSYKHDFMARHLEIPQDKQEVFFNLYDAMEDELMAVDAQTRNLEHSLDNASEATDEDYMNATKAIVAQKRKEADIEQRYFEQFEQVLTPRQVFNIKRVEKAFNKHLMREHRRSRTHR